MCEYECVSVSVCVCVCVCVMVENDLIMYIPACLSHVFAERNEEKDQV